MGERLRKSKYITTSQMPLSCFAWPSCYGVCYTQVAKRLFPLWNVLQSEKQNLISVHMPISTGSLHKKQVDSFCIWVIIYKRIFPKYRHNTCKNVKRMRLIVCASICYIGLIQKFHSFILLCSLSIPTYSYSGSQGMLDLSVHAFVLRQEAHSQQ